MKQEKLSILFPRQDEVTYREIPEESWNDLGLDAITERIAAKPQEVPLIRRVMMNLTADPRVAAFRIDVFDDILRHPEIREKLMALLDKVRMFYDYGVVNRHEGDEAGIWDLMHRLEEYHDYILTVEAIRECLSEKDLVSEGLTGLRDAVNRIYEEKGFEALRKDVEEMRVAASEIRSLTVGINLNDRFEAVSMGLAPCGGDTVRFSDCDINGHMTSGAYMALACDALGLWEGDTPRYIRMIQLDFSSEVKPGTPLDFSRGEEFGLLYLRGTKPDGVVAFTAACVY